jgi:adenylate kinase
LTGAPATGKSSICSAIAELIAQVRIVSYSTMLRQTVAARIAKSLDALEIRQQSAAIVTREDVQATDDMLVREVLAARQSHHVIVDSHPVTKEVYGFRVTAFTVDQLQALNPDVIVCTYAPAEELERRVRADPQGRALSSLYELDMHVKLQATVAAQYGVVLGRTSYFLDTSPPLHEVVEKFLTVTKIS